MTASTPARQNPRGEPSWADWKQAKAGTRVRHVRTGRTGTFVRAGGNGGRRAVNAARMRLTARAEKGE